MKVTVKFFSLAKNATGTNQCTLELSEGLTIGQVVEKLTVQYPRLIPHTSSFLTAVNLEYKAPGHVLVDGDVLALIPPVSGGNNFEGEDLSIRLSPLDILGAIESVRDPACGAITLFIGTVRRDPNIDRLEYEAYDEMALKMFREIRSEAIRIFQVRDMAIHHRIGLLDAGEDSILIAVSAPHRNEAFRACEFAIAEIKRNVPIWKQTANEETRSENIHSTSDTGPRPSVIVDISRKALSDRLSRAAGKIELSKKTIEAIRNGNNGKGEVLATAKVAGIQAVKMTPYAIPNCHVIPFTGATVSLNLEETALTCECEVRTRYSTGVEMEALHGCAVALLTVWDMVKELEKDRDGQYPATRIGDLRIVLKQKVEEVEI